MAAARCGRRPIRAALTQPKDNPMMKCSPVRHVPQRCKPFHNQPCQGNRPVAGQQTPRQHSQQRTPSRQINKPMKPVPFIKGSAGPCVLLKIGNSTCFLAPNAAAAAVAMDALGAMLPVRESESQATGPASRALIHGALPALHWLELESVIDRPQFADEADYQASQTREANDPESTPRN